MHSWRCSRSVVLAFALGALGCARSPAPIATGAEPRAVDPFLDTLEVRTFDFFWNTTNPENGLVPDRWPTRSFSSVAAIGFGLTAYPIGVKRGYVTREQAAERVLTTLRFLWNAPQSPAATGMTGYRGFFYHFLDMQTGERFEQVELSTIDTALLMAGVLFCQEYFAGSGPEEAAIRAYADSLYLRVQWDSVQPRAPLIGMGWTPEHGLHGYDYTGYNEAMILYLLALGSPTHPIDPAAWPTYTSSYRWGTFYGQEYVQFAPLFGYQYSHVWIDLRGIRDAYMREKGIDYFENSRRATFAQRAYAIANPRGWSGYDEEVWGLTASDGPKDTTVAVNGAPREFHTYWARGAAATEIRDDGTIAPTAAGGSIPFAPEIAIPALKAMRRRYGDELFTTYGFVDAFNPTFTFSFPTPQGRVVPGEGWFDTDYLGIDQGPIVAMIENHRSGLVWETMKKNPYLVCGLLRAGFTGGWLEAARTPEQRASCPLPRAA